jgi:hypothetical protein
MPSAMPSTGIFALQLTMRDFDLDGDVDILFAATPASLLYRNDGTGAFTQVVTIPAAAVDVGDFNGDGLPDVACASSPPTPGGATDGIVMNTGNGTFSGYAATNLGTATSVTSVDLNGDGSDELVRSEGATVTVHGVLGGALLPATQTFVLPGGRFFACDLDGDGDLDLINDGLVPVLNAANGVLVPLHGHVVPSVYGPGYSSIAGDFDGDGDADLISYSSGGGNNLFIRYANDGAGNFTPTIPCFGGACPPSTGTFHPLDYDADGRLDLFLAQANVLFHNDGGSWSPAATFAHPYWTNCVAAGDLNGDGRRDLVIGNMLTTGPVGGASSYVAFNLGPAGFSTLVPLPGLHGTHQVALLDADGDLDVDIVEANSIGSAAPDASVLLLNDGTGSFAPAPPSALPIGPAARVIAADFDGDGDFDLVMEGQVLLNDGTGTFVPAPISPGFWAIVVDAFDADADGDVDLLMFPAGSAPITIFYNDGTGAFPATEPLAIPGLTTDPPARADFDGDGDQDLATSWGPRILSNTTRQLARGLIARPGRTASLDLYGPPGSQWQLWVSGGTASIPVPNWGTVFIDPLTAALFATGIFPASGTASVSGAIPNNPALIGLTAWFQAAVLPQHALTNGEVIQILGL